MRDAYVRLVGDKGVEISGSDDDLLELMAAMLESWEQHGFWTKELVMGLTQLKLQVEAEKE